MRTQEDINAALEQNKQKGKATLIMFCTVTAKDLKEREMKADQDEVCVRLLPVMGGALSLCNIDGVVWSGGTSRDGSGEICVWRTSDYKLMKKFEILDVPCVDNISLIGEYVFTSSSRAGQVTVWGRAIPAQLITVIQVTLNTKIVSIVPSPNGESVWMGGRNPGALIKYTVPPRPRISQRKDRAPADQIDVDERTFRKWISHMLKSNPDYAELDAQRAERTVLVTFQPGMVKGFTNTGKKITAVKVGSQAAKAGVRVGWRIQEVNGKNPGHEHTLIH